MNRAALDALLAHWRRHPLQFLTLVVGLALATGLWTGVQAINAQARLSYARAAATPAPGRVRCSTTTSSTAPRNGCVPPPSAGGSSPGPRLGIGSFHRW